MPDAASSPHDNISRAVALVLLVAAVAGLTANHLHVVRTGGDAEGLPLFLEHLFVLALTLSMVLLFATVGRSVLQRFQIEFGSPTEELAFAVGAGLGFVGTLILAMGLAGMLHGVAFGGLFIGLVLFIRREIPKTLRLSGRALRALYVERAGPPLGIFALVVLVAVAFLLAILSVAPPTDWDSLMYHLTIPARFLSEGRIYVPEDNLHVSRVGLANMLYLPLLIAGGTVAPAVLSACLALVLGLALFAFSQRYLFQPTSSLVLASIWGTTSIILVAITPRVDVTLTLFLFLAHYALLHALLSHGRRHFYLGAVFLGFAFGVKFHAIPYSIALVPLVVLAAHEQSDGIRATFRCLLGFLLVGLVTALPWLAKNWVLLQAPLYPFFSPRLLEPWLVPLYGGALVPDFIDSRIFDWVWDLRRSFNLRDLILAPGRLTIEAEGNLYFFNLLLFALPFWVFSRRNRAINWLLAPAAIYMLVLLIPFPRTNLRYLVPALVPLTVVACHVLVTLWGRFLSPGALRVALTFLGGIVLLPSLAGLYLWLSLTGATSLFLGATSRSEYLHNHRWFGDLMDATQWANSNLPDHTRILLLFEARGYYFEKDLLQDNLGANLPLLMMAWNGEDCLEDSTITHILVNTGALEYFLDGGLDPRLLQRDRFERYRERCLESIYRGVYLELYRVRDSGLSLKTGFSSSYRRGPPGAWSLLRDDRSGVVEAPVSKSQPIFGLRHEFSASYNRNPPYDIFHR